MRRKCFQVLLPLFFVFCAVSDAQRAVPDQKPKLTTLKFSGYEWEVIDATNQAPGPNHWDSNNAKVDEDGALHLKITHHDDKWYCVKLRMKDKQLGFGRYQFELIGRVDELDPNVVLGLFNYLGPTGFRETDIEFAKWGKDQATNLQYTVWPQQAIEAAEAKDEKEAKNKKEPAEKADKRFEARLHGTYTTHIFDWFPNKVSFESMHGHPEGEGPGDKDRKDRDDKPVEIASWTYAPDNPKIHISQQPMQVDINLWLFEGHPPKDGKDVELVINSFKFTPNKDGGS